MGAQWVGCRVVRGLLGGGGSRDGGRGSREMLWGCHSPPALMPVCPPSPRMTILPPTEKLQVLLEKLSSFYAKFVKEYS